jgi:hypothetical protein
MMDFSIAKFEIPIDIKKALDKGKIDEVCRGLYAAADVAAAEETTRLLATKPYELLDERLKVAQGTKPDETLWSARVMKEAAEYRQQRTEYWFRQFLQALEIYAKTKPDRSS